MSFSSVLGASSAIRAGVVTSSTRPSSPFVGQLIYESDTNRLAAYNGSAWVTQNGLQLLTSQTVTSSSSFSLPTNTFSSVYDCYRIIGAFTSTATGASQTVTMRLRASGTDNSSSNYQTANLRGSTAIAGATASSSLTTSFLLVPAMTAPNRISFSIDIYSPFATDQTHITGTVSALQNDTDMFAITATGVTTVTTSYDSASFILSSGGFTGRYRVYGYASN